MGNPDWEVSFGFFDQFLGDDDEEPEGLLDTGAMGMLDPRNPTKFSESHIMSRIFEPIKKDIGPKERTDGNSNTFSKYANLDEVENENWRFGHKVP